ncbi:MAG: hypothetical protein Q9190_004162 [Brigantiaea leucoxantha]
MKRSVPDAQPPDNSLPDAPSYMDFTFASGKYPGGHDDGPANKKRLGEKLKIISNLEDELAEAKKKVTDKEFRIRSLNKAKEKIATLEKEAAETDESIRGLYNEIKGYQEREVDLKKRDVDRELTVADQNAKLQNLLFEYQHGEYKEKQDEILKENERLKQELWEAGAAQALQAGINALDVKREVEGLIGQKDSRIQELELQLSETTKECETKKSYWERSQDEFIARLQQTQGQKEHLEAQFEEQVNERCERQRQQFEERFDKEILQRLEEQKVERPSIDNTEKQELRAQSEKLSEQLETQARQFQEEVGKQQQQRVEIEKNLTKQLETQKKLFQEAFAKELNERAEAEKKELNEQVEAEKKELSEQFKAHIKQFQGDYTELSQRVETKNKLTKQLKSQKKQLQGEFDKQLNERVEIENNLNAQLEIQRQQLSQRLEIEKNLNEQLEAQRQLFREELDKEVNQRVEAEKLQLHEQLETEKNQLQEDFDTEMSEGAENQEPQPEARLRTELSQQLETERLEKKFHEELERRRLAMEEEYRKRLEMEKQPLELKIQQLESKNQHLDPEVQPLELKFQQLGLNNQDSESEKQTSTTEKQQLELDNMKHQFESEKLQVEQKLKQEYEEVEKKTSTIEKQQLELDNMKHQFESEKLQIEQKLKQEYEEEYKEKEQAIKQRTRQEVEREHAYHNQMQKIKFEAKERQLELKDQECRLLKKSYRDLEDKHGKEMDTWTADMAKRQTEIRASEGIIQDLKAKIKQKEKQLKASTAHLSEGKEGADGQAAKIENLQKQAEHLSAEIKSLKEERDTSIGILQSELTQALFTAKTRADDMYRLRINKDKELEEQRKVFEHNEDILIEALTDEIKRLTAAQKGATDECQKAMEKMKNGEEDYEKLKKNYDAAVKEITLLKDRTKKISSTKASSSKTSSRPSGSTPEKGKAVESQASAPAEEKLPLSEELRRAYQRFVSDSSSDEGKKKKLPTLNTLTKAKFVQRSAGLKRQRIESLEHFLGLTTRDAERLYQALSPIEINEHRRRHLIARAALDEDPTGLITGLLAKTISASDLYPQPIALPVAKAPDKTGHSFTSEVDEVTTSLGTNPPAAGPERFMAHNVTEMYEFTMPDSDKSEQNLPTVKAPDKTGHSLVLEVDEVPTSSGINPPVAGPERFMAHNVTDMYEFTMQVDEEVIMEEKPIMAEKQTQTAEVKGQSEHPSWMKIFYYLMRILLLVGLLALFVGAACYGESARRERNMWLATNDLTRRAVVSLRAGGGTGTGVPSWFWDGPLLDLSGGW